MKNILTRKIKIFPDWLESKTTNIVFPILVFAVILYFFSSSIQTIWVQAKCESRGYKWFPIPPSGKPSVTQNIRESVYKKIGNHYREEYAWGVCADMGKTFK